MSQAYSYCFSKADNEFVKLNVGGGAWSTWHDFTWCRSFEQKLCAWISPMIKYRHGEEKYKIPIPEWENLLLISKDKSLDWKMVAWQPADHYMSGAVGRDDNHNTVHHWTVHMRNLERSLLSIWQSTAVVPQLTICEKIGGDLSAFVFFFLAGGTKGGIIKLVPFI